MNEPPMAGLSFSIWNRVGVTWTWQVLMGTAGNRLGTAGNCHNPGFAVISRRIAWCFTGFTLHEVYLEPEYRRFIHGRALKE